MGNCPGGGVSLMENRPGWELSMWRIVLVESSPGGSCPGGGVIQVGYFLAP